MNNQIEIHNKNAFKKMHNAGALAADVLDYITQLYNPRRVHAE